jgi:hypothetical protein
MTSANSEIPWFKISAYIIGGFAGIYAIYWIINKFWPLLMAGGLGMAAAKFMPGIFGGGGGGGNGAANSEAEEETEEEKTPAENEMDAAQASQTEETTGSAAEESEAAEATQEAATAGEGAAAIETGGAAEAEAILSDIAEMAVIGL